MSEAELTLAAEFEPASREQWLALVGKVLKGGDFEKRLVSRTADGLAIQPLYTRTEGAAGVLVQGRSGQLRGTWDVRQRVVEPDPKAANAAILEDLTGGVTSILLQIDAPGQGGLADDAETLAAALNGVLLDGCPIALDARENALDAAGSLIQNLARQGNCRDRPPGRHQLRSAGRAGQDRHALPPGRALLRDRRQARRRLRRHAQRDGAAGRRAALSRGRRQRGAGAGCDAGDIRRLSARLRSRRACTRCSAGPHRRRACRPTPTCFSPWPSCAPRAGCWLGWRTHVARELPRAARRSPPPRRSA